MPADDLPAPVAAHPDVRHVHLVREVAPVEPRRLAVAGDEHGGVAVDLRVDLLVGPVVDLVRAGGGLEERLAVELAGGAVERELGGEQLLEPRPVVLVHGGHELVRERDQLVEDRHA